ncbi:LysR family transcriptional regulator [Paenalcaligenes niemegkensis]|uniref:LysR family transcriptional regulator n=1 Tax=Paenalcaligenes niemegkensis TaxID=2895469 RepID=UPI001EE7D498|nr:LysR family transcriptional regulator [Paenalcaligenes niemegkensis]MCQ9615504.1 LysR family transcriptional regulator [Paenalcaligenes niemegkensis]
MKANKALDIRALRIFVTVAATGSLTQAANELGLTQSAVSQVIAQIETIIGVPMLDRSKRPLKLTAAGISLNRGARHLVLEMDKLIAQTREAAQLSRGEVRLGMIDSFSATVGPHVLNTTLQNASRILAWSGLATVHANGLLNRQLDLIISSDPCEEADGLVRTPLYREPFLLVVPKGMESKFKDKDLPDCAQLAPFIRFSERSHYGAVVERHLRRRNVAIPHYLEIDTADVVLAMVASRLGWAIASPLCVLQGIGYWEKLSVLPLPGPGFSRTIYLISRSGENEDVRADIYKSCQKALDEHVLPVLKKKIPWLE